MLDESYSTDGGLDKVCEAVGVNSSDYVGYIVILSSHPEADDPRPAMFSDTDNLGNIVYATGYVAAAIGEQIAEETARIRMHAHIQECKECRDGAYGDCGK